MGSIFEELSNFIDSKNHCDHDELIKDIKEFQKTKRAQIRNDVLKSDQYNSIILLSIEKEN